jgi:hypothetical protein
MGSHTENMKDVCETLKASEKGRLEAEHQRKEDFGPFIENIKGRIQEIQKETRDFLKDFRTDFKEVQADLRGGAKTWQNYKRGR